MEYKVEQNKIGEGLAQEFTIYHHKKRSGSCSKGQREKRRQEVFRLHFILGYSMVEIAKLMNFNYKTVEKDVTQLNARLAKEWGRTPLRAFIQKQITRLEFQRTRLMTMLEKVENPETKLRTEQLILEIDSRLAQLVSRMIGSRERIADTASKVMNKEAEKQGWNIRWISSRTLTSLPRNKHEQVMQIVEDSQYG